MDKHRRADIYSVFCSKQLRIAEGQSIDPPGIANRLSCCNVCQGNLQYLTGYGNDNLRELMEQLMTWSRNCLQTTSLDCLQMTKKKFADSGKGVGVYVFHPSADGSSGSTLTYRHPKANFLAVDFQRRTLARRLSRGRAQANFPEHRRRVQPADPPLFSATDTAVELETN